MMKNMDDRYFVHIFTPTKNVSPFDVNMAHSAQIEGVIPYTEVGLDDIHYLTQDLIYSQGSQRTGIFIGGRDYGLAIDMFYRAKAAMFPPFEVSIFADPSGAITTAAAMVACVEVWVKNKTSETLEGKKILILGGTGPVGVCSGILASKCGAEVFLGSTRGKKVGQAIADEYNSRFDVNMQGENIGSDKATENLLQTSDVIINAAKAGLQVISKSQLEQAPELIVATDANAVPPAGIEGVDINDMGKELDFTPKKAVGIGALKIGHIKNKVHHRLFEMMRETDKPIYIDHEKAFEVARVFAAK
jgi:methylene-tetrahydromethanopterin dehydrogenase